MARIPGRTGSPTAPVATDPIRPPIDNDVSPARVNDVSPLDMDACERTGSGVPAVLESYFTPLDEAAKAELALLDTVIHARKNDPKTYPASENPYRIQYAVYNLRSKAIIQKLFDAVDAGVHVKVLIEGKQIAPDKPWNKVDDLFEEKGLDVIYDDRTVDMAERKAASLVGIMSNHLMHLKARIFDYRDPKTGEQQSMVLSGSMNPGDGAATNDENINLIRDDRVVELYKQKFDDVLEHQRTENQFDVNASINVLFTPCKKGPRPIEKLFEWIDAEQELIVLSVFDLKNIVDPASKKNLVEKLAEAKARGVKVFAITDRKKSDGRNAAGERVRMYGHYASNHWLDEDLEKEGIPVYEFSNETTKFSAMHPKAAVFGLENMKVISGAGNWTRAGMGSGNKRGRNEESFIFIDSGKLDDNRTGRRYLANCLHLLRKYDGQDPDHQPAEELISDLQKLPNWPEVSVEVGSLAPPDFDGKVFLVGEHASLKGRAGEPGLRLNAVSGPLAARLQPELKLPFGTEIDYRLTDAQGADIPQANAGATLLIVPRGDAPNFPVAPGDTDDQ